MVTLVADRPWYVWGEEIRVRYEGTPDDFRAAAPLVGAVELLGSSGAVRGEVAFTASIYAPQMDGYVFEAAAGDPTGRLWVGRPA